MNPVERGLRAVDRFQQRRQVLGFLVAVAKKFGDDEAGAYAALLAYYGFFSLFPLLLVLVTVLGFALRDDPGLQQRVLQSALGQFPVIGEQMQRDIHSLRGTGLSLTVGIAGTLWGGLGVTQAAQNAMNAVWNVPRKRRPNIWLRLGRGLSLLVVLGAGVFTTTAVAALGTIAGPGLFGRILSLVGSVAVNLLLFLGAFKVLTALTLPWRRLLPGAAVAALGWAVLQAVGVYAVSSRIAYASQIYGLFALVIGLLSWLYVAAQLTLYAAELNVVLARRLWPRSLLQPPLTQPDKRVLTHLAYVEERRPEETVEVSFSGEANDSDQGNHPSPDR